MKLIKTDQRPIKHLDRIRIDTKEDSTSGSTLGAFSTGVYYFRYQQACQEWEVIRTAKEGELKYEDTFTLKNCYYTDQYLQEYYYNQSNMYYLTTSKAPTVWRFGRVSLHN